MPPRQLGALGQSHTRTRDTRPRVAEVRARNSGSVICLSVAAAATNPICIIWTGRANDRCRGEEYWPPPLARPPFMAGITAGQRMHEEH